jgi:hypothetical protein
VPPSVGMAVCEREVFAAVSGSSRRSLTVCTECGRALSGEGHFGWSQAFQPWYVVHRESFESESFTCRHVVKVTNANAGQSPSHVPGGGIESTADESVFGCATARSPSSPPCSASAGRDPLTVCRATAGTVGIGRALARWARAPLHVVKVALRGLTTCRIADDAWLESPCHPPVAIGPEAGRRPLARP